MLAPNPAEVTHETKFYVVVVAENSNKPESEWESSKTMVMGRPIFTAKERRGYFRGGACAMLASEPGLIAPSPGVTWVGVLCAQATLYSESNGSRLWSCPVIVAGPVRMRLLKANHDAAITNFRRAGGVCGYGRRILRWRESPAPEGPKERDTPRRFKRRRIKTPILIKQLSDETSYRTLPLILQ